MSEINAAVFSGNLRAEMARKHMTSAMVARALEMDSRRITDLWLGRMRPDPELVERIASLLEIPPWRLTRNPDFCTCGRLKCPTA